MKLTIVGRVSDGVVLAQGPRYVNEENYNICTYKQQGEFLLQEISRGALPPSKMTIFLDGHSFNYMVENGMCFMVLCDSSYPRKLAFHYLQDLANEFKKFDMILIQRIMRPYSFTKFDGIIGNIKGRYVDTRTQANLSKINSSQDEDIISESFSQVVKRRRRYEMLERMSEAHLHASPLWCSKRLEIIALKWIPAGLMLAVTSLIIWSSLIHRHDLYIT
ncbi:hypothetical protein BUALT_Bualt06G0112300 [Buddleja alternifolia]|uniref:Longin domain-containing protein n=1 Tax=Buddleja alternifolia TaxID=168488 RepID=A0AAV6XE17_9LAMI|nr:hypothetical protein BUALT_Bualt06G0112300 [Buddleja alternifolia]